MIISKLQISLFYSIVFIYASLYFFPFNQGITDLPIYFKLLKEVLVLVISLLSFYYFREEILERLKNNFIYFIFVSYLSILFFISLIQGIDLVPHDMRLVVYPFLVLFWPKFLFDYFIKRLNYIILIQFAICICFELLGFKIWDDGDYVGSLGNPNAFGLFANICVIYLLNAQETKLNYVALLVSAWCALHSKSLSQQLILFFIISSYWIYYLFVSSSKKNVLKLTSLGIFSLLVLFFTDVLNFFVFDSLSQFVKSLFIEGPIEKTISYSISGRTKNFYDMLDVWSHMNFLKVFFGLKTSGQSFSSDCEYFVIATNYGLIGIFLFSVAFITKIVEALRNYKDRKGFTHLLIISCFLLTFVFTTFVNYFPIAVVFYLILFNEQAIDQSR